ncbi:MAG: S24 family peptidase [Candidatus Omnitrophica bacterium]|nr:S24 family peptidase [Candidatus Omnitrophota bacterium]
MAKQLLFKLKGSSMYPLIRDESFILVKPTKKIFFGELVVFKDREKIICHRLIFKKNNFFYSKGDAQIKIEKVKIDNILGKVIMVIDSKNRIFSDNFYWRFKSSLFFFFTPILIIFLNFLREKNGKNLYS